MKSHDHIISTGFYLPKQPNTLVYTQFFILCFINWNLWNLAYIEIIDSCDCFKAVRRKPICSCKLEHSAPAILLLCLRASSPARLVCQVYELADPIRPAGSWTLATVRELGDLRVTQYEEPSQTEFMRKYEGGHASLKLVWQTAQQLRRDLREILNKSGRTVRTTTVTRSLVGDSHF